MTKEEIRLAESRDRKKHWKRWGPYLTERAWGTVREDYSTHGNAWEYFPHDHARSRAYRWTEDGLAGSHEFSCVMKVVIDLFLTGSRSSRLIPTGAICYSSTNTSTRIPAPGLGASHQTGWTGLVTKLLQQSGESREEGKRELAGARTASP